MGTQCTTRSPAEIPRSSSSRPPWRRWRRRCMAAAASPSLRVREIYMRGGGSLESRPPQQPCLGRLQRATGVVREMGSAFPRNTELTSHSAAHSISTSHGSASCCNVCHQRQGPWWLLDAPCCQILEEQAGVPVLMCTRASLDQYSHVTSN